MTQGSDYPWDPEDQAAIVAAGGTVPPPPPPPPPPMPGPGGGFPAARLTDPTAHFGMIGPVVSGNTVLIGFMPAATLGDPQTCPMFDGPKPHVGGTITKGSSTVLICNKPAARVSDPTECKGPPGIIQMGESTVLIGESGGGGGGGGGGEGSGGGGGGGGGSGGQPAQPMSYDPAEPAPVPASHAGPLQGPPQELAHTWIGVSLQDFEGQPMPNQPFQVTLEGGQVLSGTTDDKGQMRFENVQPDQGDLTFTQLTDQEQEDGGGATGVRDEDEATEEEDLDDIEAQQMEEAELQASQMETGEVDSLQGAEDLEQGQADESQQATQSTATDEQAETSQEDEDEQPRPPVPGGGA